MAAGPRGSPARSTLQRNGRLMFIHTVAPRIRTRRNILSAVLPPTALAAALSWCAAPTVCAQAPGGRNAASLERTVDASIRPGDDFFAYANGSWLKATEIPAGKGRWGVRNEINDLTRTRVMQLLDDASNAPLGSTAREVA